MNKYFAGLAAIALVIAMASGAIAGTTTSSVGAIATVTNACQFGGSPQIDFGTGDAAVGFGAVLYTQPTLWCTNGYTATVEANGGLNGGTPITGPWFLRSATTGDTIAYTFAYTTAPAGLGKATTNILTLSGASITGSLDLVQAANDYTDTVVLTINY